MAIRIKHITAQLCQFGLILIGISSVSLYAQPSTTLEQIKQIELANLAAGAKAQQQTEQLDDERLQLADEYRRTLKQNANLKRYNEQQRLNTLSQEKQVQSLQKQINSISHLERDIVPLMLDMLDALENFIALDLPFLLTERTDRIRKLRELMNEGNVSNSEKYRRILEAYQIENDYGRTIEVYDEELTRNNSGVSQKVIFLKIGRIAYLYQTTDKQASYRWSAKKNQWRRLDNSYNAQITEAIKMAKEQIPSNLVSVPVIAPAPTDSSGSYDLSTMLNRSGKNGVPL